MGSRNFINWGLFALLALIWGSSFILMKKSAEQLTGIQIGAIRIVAAGLAFLPLALVHLFQVPARKLFAILLSGVLGNLLPAFLFASAIAQDGESSLASILNSLTPLFVVVIGLLFFRAKVERMKIIGVLIGFAGLVLLSVSRGPLSGGNGLLLILIATVCYGVTVNLVGYYLKGISPVKIATISLTMVALPAAFVMYREDLFSRLRYDSEARDAMALAALLGVAGSAIATAFFYMLIQRAGALFASLVTYAIPIVAIFWGLLAGESIGILQFGSLALILGGVALANAKRER
jgi:drug/metabolite transporter (DMT)-like permease